MDTKWKGLINLAKKKHSTFSEPILPFKDDVVLSEFNSVYKSIYNKEKFLNE